LGRALKVDPVDKKERIKGLYFIADAADNTDDLVRAVLRGGASAVQLRVKDGTVKELYDAALKLRDIVRGAGALFIVNDSVEVAMAAGADGVHVGQGDMPAAAVRKVVGPDMIIGVSTHSVEEAVAAQEDGADYVGFGPVFPTTSKPDADTVKGPEAIKEIKAAVKIPVVAIGGIDTDNVRDVVSAGADAAAVFAAIAGADDPEGAAAAITKAFGL